MTFWKRSTIVSSTSLRQWCIPKPTSVAMCSTSRIWKAQRSRMSFRWLRSARLSCKECAVEAARGQASPVHVAMLLLAQFFRHHHHILLLSRPKDCKPGRLLNHIAGKLPVQVIDSGHRGAVEADDDVTLSH